MSKNMPPSRYRMISPQLTISAPLKPNNAKFIHESGCRKIITLSGGFVNADVVMALKQSGMSVEHFPFDVTSPSTMQEDQVKRVCDRIIELLKFGSNIHLVCGQDMQETASVVGVIRRSYHDWPTSSAVSESLDICKYNDADTVASIIINTDIAHWA